MDRRRDCEESDDEEEFEGDDLRQLELDRNYNDQKLKTRFEHIFRKYGHDFEGIGDEIEIASGDIVVDNGHLQHMRHEHDPGKSASSRFVKTFQEKLGYEDESSEEEDDDQEDGTTDEEDDEDSGSDETSDNPEQRSGRANASSSYAKHKGRLSPRKAMNAFGDLARPAPRLAHLLVGQETPQPAPIAGTEYGNADDSSIESTSGTSTPVNILNRLPGLQESMRALQPRAKRSAVDPEAIEALGVSIANQLAQLMAGPSKKKSKKNSHAKAKKVTKESIWDYPELGSKPRKRRHRSPTPIRQALPSSPARGSPGEESLWAPEGSVRPSKRLRRQREDTAATQTPAMARTTRLHLPSSGNGTSKKEVKRCWNCSLTSTPSWQKGPHGQDLCESCARYYLHHRRMKPFDSPTPSVEDEEDAEDRHVNDNADDSRKHSRPTQRDESVFEATPAPSMARNAQDRGDNAAAADAHGQAHSSDYFYLPAPVHVPAMQMPTDSPVASHKPPTPKQRQRVAQPVGPEEQRQRRTQRISYSDTAAQTLEWVQQNTIPEQPHESAHTANRDAIHSSSMRDHPREGREVLQEAPATTQRPPDVDNQNMHIQPDFAYSANTSRTLVTSPNTQAKGHFTLEEDALLIRLKEREMLTWDAIAPYFPHRNLYTLSGRYNRELKFGPNPARAYLEAQENQTTDDEEQEVDEDDPLLMKDLAWNDGQDELLLELREDQELEWDEISSLLPGHSPDAVEERYELLAARGIEQHNEKHNLALPVLPENNATEEEDRARTQTRNLTFLPEEDAYLVRLKEVEGLSWAEVSKRFRTRPLQAIQRHYSRCLAPSKRKTLPTSKHDLISGTMEDRILAVDPQLGGLAPFQPAEDESIRKLREVDKLSWEAIAQQLPGRTGQTVQHRYEYKFAAEAARIEAEKNAWTPKLPQSASIANLPGMTVTRWTTKEAPSQPAFIDYRRTVIPPAPTTPVATQSPPKTSKSGPGARTPFTQDEDDAILQLREMQGMSWEDIALRLPGRSVNSIASRYTEVIRPIQAADKRNVGEQLPTPSPITASSSRSSLQIASQGSTTTSKLATVALPPNEIAAATSSRSAISTRPEILKPRPRSSLPSTLPSTSRSHNPLLRKALDNSIRRRSDIGTTSHVGSSAAVENIQTKKKHYHDNEAPSRQLFREMESSLHTPSPASRFPEHPVQSQANDDSSSESSESGDRPVFEELMRAATKFAVQQKNPALFDRVKEIHDKNPNDQRLHQLLKATSSSSISTADVFRAFESIVSPPRPAGNDRSGSQHGLRHPQVGQSPSIVPDQPLFGILYPTPTKQSRAVHGSRRRSKSTHSADGDASDLDIDSAEPVVPQQSGQRQARRAAFDIASRKNTELFSLPVGDVMLVEAANEMPPVTVRPNTSPRQTRRGSSGSEILDPDMPKNPKPRGRPSIARTVPQHLVPETLIREAFEASGDRVMRPKDIFAWIEAHHDDIYTNWQGRIRTALSRSALFHRAITDDGHRGWRLVSAVGEDSRSLDEQADTGQAIKQRKAPFKDAVDSDYAPGNEDDNNSESTSVVDEDDAIVVSVGPKQRRFVSTGSNSRMNAGKAKESESQVVAKRRNRPFQRHNTDLRPVSGENNALELAASAEIANSDEEEELHLEASLEEPDELERPTERPLSRAAKDRLLSSDINRDPISSDPPGPSGQQSSSAAKASKASTLPSSSPQFMKPHTPASAFNRKHVTPRISSARQSQLRMETPGRSQSPAIFMPRSASVASLRRSSFGKRVVETPVREVDSDEDELA